MLRQVMQIRVLGHLEASVGDQPLSLGGAKQRAVLAMLVLEANRTVSADRLIEGLWGADVPASAPKMLQNYVWRLRGVLQEDGDAHIVTHGRGYELRIDPESVDVHRLERLVAEAGRPGASNGAAHEAVALFRGDPLADLVDEPFAAPEVRRLEELRRTATELALEADLAAGRHQQVMGAIEALLAEDPLRERVHRLRMLALYRSGRQAEALEAYREARRTLVDEVGIEPGPELRRLHEAILRQDPALDVEPFAAELPRELDAAAAPPLIGREGELRRLRARWQRAAAGAGALVTVTGAYGMGKTRLAAALAAEAHRQEATVLYAPGTGAPESALASLARVRDARRPTLLVLDDADRAPADVQAAAHELARRLGSVPALVVALGQEAAALARLAPHDAVTLEPLDADAVRQIAELYGPSREAVPVETLLASTRGVARRVHEAASEWARREATRRVDAVAGRAAAGRSEARALEAELAGSVADLQSARERAGLVARRDDGAVVCPYKGLATFDASDADYFFGREQLVAELVARLVGATLLGVVGPSGSGKSSAVRAGLLPALAGGVLPGSDGWTQVLIRPGEHPLRELERAGDRLLARRTVLAVDQFEELFTACRDEDERAGFVAALMRAARDPAAATLVVLAVRADFYGRCAAYPELSALLGANHVLVGPMAPDELRRAIERPAQRGGLSVEPELVDALLADVEGEPGALPLLSTALLELWRGRDGRRLRLSAYTRSGGVQGAVARLAEDAYASLDAGEQAVARKVLLRLAGEGEGGAPVRRRVALGDLAENGAEVVGRLVERRLLTAGDGAVEVAHEALLREWPRLRAWLDEDVHGRRLHRQVSDAAHAWEADARDPGALYRGARLTAALEWRAGHEDELSAGERVFLDASSAAAERSQRRLRLVLGGVSLLLAAAVVAGLVALDQRGRARTGERIAEAQRLGALALSEPALDRSLLLAREAVALDDNRATRDTMLAALLRSPAAVRVMRGDGGRMLSVAVRPDGNAVVAGDNHGRLIAFDAEGRRLGPRYDARQPIQAMRFSADGTRLAVATGDEFDGWLVLLDGTSLRRIARRRLPARDEPFRTMVFSPDSSVLVTSWAPLEPDGAPGRGLLTRWDSHSGRRLGRPIPLTREGAFLVAFAGSGEEIVTMQPAEGHTVVRDTDTLDVVRRVPGAGLHWVSAVSADGRTAVLVPDDGPLSLVDLRSGTSRTLPARHDGPVKSAGFAPDGRSLVTTGDDAKVVVWDVRSATSTAVFEGHAGSVAGVAIAPDGRTAYTAGLDGTVIAWDLSGDRRLGRQFSAARQRRVQTLFAETRYFDETVTSWNIAASARGDMLAVGTNESVVNLIDGGTLRIARRLRDAGAVPVFDRDGRTLAVGGNPYLGLWDARTGTLLHRKRVTDGAPLWGPRISADGRWIAVSGNDQMVRIWDARRFEQVKTRRMDFGARDLSIRPDGKVVVVPVDGGTGRGRVEILAVPTLERVAQIPWPHTRWSSFSRDGRMFVVGDHEGRAQIFDGYTFKPRARRLVGHAGTITNADFSPDGRTVATGSGDGTVRLWDTATGRPIARPLPGLPNVEVGVAFMGPNRLAAVYYTGQAFLWDVRSGSWLRRACAVAGRPLTRQEWSDVMPGRAYAPACAT